MLTSARRWALCFSIFAIVAIGPVAAFASSSGVDTPVGIHDLPLSVEGTPIIDLNDSTTPPTVTVTGNVGIGVTTPAGQLTIGGVGYSGGTAPTDGMQLYSCSNASGYCGWAGQIYIGAPTGSWATAPLIFSVPNGSGSEVKTMALLNGNVGIGTTSPTAPLNIVSNKNAGTGVLINNYTTGTLAYSSFTAQNDSGGLAYLGVTSSAYTDIPLLTGAGVIYGNGFVTGLVLDNQVANPIIFGTSNTERMRVAGNGNVGIGVSSPIVSLDVSSVAHFGGSTSPVFTSQGAYISWNGLTGGTGETDFINNPGLGTGGFDFVLSNSAGTSVSSAMYIDGSGKVGVNTTSPQATLDVNGSIHSSAPIQLATNYANGTPCSIEGQIAYSTTDVAAVSCDGTKWNLLTSLPVANNNISCTPGLPLIWNGSKWVCPVNVTNGGGGINCAATAGGPKNWSCGTGSNNDGSSAAAGICEQYGYAGLVANGFSRQGGNCGGCYYVYPTAAVPYGNPGNGCNSCEYYTSVTCY